MEAPLSRDIILGPMLEHACDHTGFMSLLCSHPGWVNDEILWTQLYPSLVQKRRLYWSRGKPHWIERPMIVGKDKANDFSCLKTTSLNSNPRAQTLKLAREAEVLDACEMLLQDRPMVVDQDQMDMYTITLLSYPGVTSPQEIVNKLAAELLELCAWEPIIRESVVFRKEDRVTSVTPIQNAVTTVWQGHRGSRGHMGNKPDTKENRIWPQVDKEKWIELISGYLFKLVGCGKEEAYVVDAYKRKMQTPMRCDNVFLLACPERIFVIYESCEF